MYQDEIATKKPIYDTHILLKASSELSPERLIAVVKQVFAAYPSLFWVIEQNEAGIPEMCMRPDLRESFSIPVLEGEKETCLRKFARPISLDTGLLFHCAVLKTPSACFLALTLHHILFDGTSIKLFVEECNRVLEGKAPRGESYTIQDAALREESLPKEKNRAYYASLFSKERKDYKLSGDRKGGMREGKIFSLSGLEREKVVAFCTRLHITENAFFQTVMALVLSKYLHCEEPVFTTGYTGRTIEAMQDTIGNLFKNIFLTVKIEGEMELSHLLKSVNQQILATMSHEAYSYYELTRDFGLHSDVEFIYQGDLFEEVQGSKLQREPWPEEELHYEVGVFLLCGQIAIHGKEYDLSFLYRADCFSETWMKGFASDFFRIAKEIPTVKRVSDLQKKVFSDYAEEA